MEPFDGRVLKVCRETERERLDLHALFEAGGNEPLHRTQVLDAVENLVREGMIEAGGGDFYSLTERGKKMVFAATAKEDATNAGFPENVSK